MKRAGLYLLLGVVAAVVLLWQFPWESYSSEEKKVPNDWFFRQRAYPTGKINHSVYREALMQRHSMESRMQAGAGNASWELEGPINIGGRITDVEMYPHDMDTIFAATASGGVFLSLDAGSTWSPIFDDELTLSIGDIELDLSQNIIYVGTGEVNGGGGSMTYDGYGIYKSEDAGQSWTHLGLEETRYIGRVQVDPHDPNRIYVGAMGALFGDTRERGVYRSSDGGSSWDKVHFLNDSTGCVDLAINPINSDTIYAAMWERVRRPERRSYGGEGSGIWRSIDGGDTWEELTNGLPAGTDVGRIGIDVCESAPNILYAIYMDRTGFFEGVYRSNDGGDTWQSTNDGALANNFSSYGWWFSNLRIDPTDPDHVYVAGLYVYRTNNGGQSYVQTSSNIHVDQHGLYIHPLDPDFVVAGNDGGVYVTENDGNSWTHKSEMPITQFYTSEIDFQNPEHLYGGTQDNGTIRTLTGATDDWHAIYFGDGFYVLVDPGDNNYIYAEYQYGGLARSVNGGLSFVSALNGVSGSDRKNWSSPLAMDPGDPQTLYFGTQRVYKSTNRAANWTAISDDLTNGSGGGNLVFGTLTTLAVAESNPDVIYAGSDDGNIWMTQNGGTDWVYVSADLPDHWITRVAIDPHDSQIAYATISGYRWDGYLPYLFRTIDNGTTWEDLSANLPQAPLTDIIIDPDNAGTLIVSGDAGVFISRDDGISWDVLGKDLPFSPVTDLTFHVPTRTLLAATFGRSMYTIEVEDTPTGLAESEENLPGQVTLNQNYPNPFNPATMISYQISTASSVSLKVYDITGKLVKTLVDAQQPAKFYEVNWDGTNDAGQRVSSGVYIYRLIADNQVRVRRMVLTR